MKILKRTKIITTIGPASENMDTMTKLFKAGMTTIRLNFSHGSYEEHGARVDMAKTIAKTEGVPMSIMLDTKGPEIRLGKFKNGTEQVNRGDIITIHASHEEFLNKLCDKGEMSVEYNMAQDLQPGNPILVDDGKLSLVTKSVDVKKGIVVAEALNSHVVKANKRINLPGTVFSMPFLSEKDKQDIEFGCDKGIDYIAASFCNTPDDIAQIRAILKSKNCEHVQIIAKVESQYAVDHIDALIEASDGIMVARGDLGLEIPYYEVPVAQKTIVRKCRLAGKPVIVATQMLDSMEKTPLPTRAEVTDVFVATEQGADATMLSGESAAGQYPVEAVTVMATINSRAEKEVYSEHFYDANLQEMSKLAKGSRSEIAKKVAAETKKGDIKFAVVLSRTGALLKEVSRFRPNTNILGVTNDARMVTAFGINSSVFMFPETSMFDALKKDPASAREVAGRYGAVKGDQFIVVENEKITKFTFN